MYIETIQTPHPDIEHWPGEITSSVSEHVRNSGVPEYLEQHDVSETQELLAAAYIQQTVRRSLRYQSGARLEVLETAQITTCVGYTLLGSEALDAAGIEHWIGFANSHAFLIMSRGTKLQTLDMLSPELNQDISGALSYGDVESLQAGLVQDGRAAVKLNTGVMAQNLGLHLQTLADEHPWMTVTSRNRAFGLNSFCETTEQERARLHAEQGLMMTVFPSDKGRDVLAAYALFQEALDTGKDSKAIQALTVLAGQYPDIDARGDSFKGVRKLVSRLSRGGETAQAKQVVSQFFSSFSVSTDTRLVEYEADCLRVIAKTCRDPEAAQLALERYESVCPNPKSFGCVADKASIARGLVADLVA